MTGEYISLEEAKDQLAVDASLTIHDDRIKRLIGAAIDWAENYTQRSLGELVDLNSPRDSTAIAIDEKVIHAMPANCGYDWTLRSELWLPTQWQTYWAAYLAAYPSMVDQSRPLRRDVKQAILLKVEVMFDRSPETMKLFEEAAESLLAPYRIAMGV